MLGQVNWLVNWRKKCLVKKAEVGKGMSASDSLAGKSLAMRDRYLYHNRVANSKVDTKHYLKHWK